MLAEEVDSNCKMNWTGIGMASIEGSCLNRSIGRDERQFVVVRRLVDVRWECKMINTEEISSIYGVFWVWWTSIVLFYGDWELMGEKLETEEITSTCGVWSKLGFNGMDFY